MLRGPYQSAAGEDQTALSTILKQRFGLAEHNALAVEQEIQQLIDKHAGEIALMLSRGEDTISSELLKTALQTLDGKTRRLSVARFGELGEVKPHRQKCSGKVLNSLQVRQRDHEEQGGVLLSRMHIAINARIAEYYQQSRLAHSDE